MKTAIITGASSGLGREIVRQLADVFPEIGCCWLIARRRDRLETAGEPARLVLRPESTEARADGESLLFVLVEFQDAQGRRVPGVRLPLSARVEGAASLLSFASANPLTDENYESGQAASFDGRAMAILRAGHTPGKAVLTLSCPGMEDAKQELFLS